MRCLRMGEIEIGINAKRKRIAKLASKESAEIRQSKMQYTFFGGRLRGRGAWSVRCITPLPMWSFPETLTVVVCN